MTEPTNEELFAAVRARAAARGGRPHGGSRYTHIEHGLNSHHSAFTRIMSDELLYRTNLIPARACHPDCELGFVRSLTSIARDYISLAGAIPPGADKPGQIMSRALNSSDFPDLLENIASKSLTMGYNNSAETWPIWIRQTTARDYRPFSRPQAPTLATPPEDTENAEITSGILGINSTAGERAQLVSYAEIVALSRESLINDDLAAITATLLSAGRAVSRLIGDKVYAVLLSNGALSDGENLFSTAHSNDAASAGAPTIAGVSALIALMNSQEGPAGESLNLLPRFLLGSSAYAAEFAEIRVAAWGDRDPNSNLKLSTIIEQRLAASSAWYAVSDPTICDSVQLVLKEGSISPLRFERKRVLSDGMLFTIGCDCQVLAVDHRAICRNAGS